MRGAGKLRLASATAWAAVAIAGCGSGSTSATHVQSTSAPPRAATRPRPASPRAGGAPIGETQHVHAGGATLSVTVTRVVDPLRDSGAALPPGARAIGVLVRIHNAGPAVYDSSATGDISIKPSSGSTAPAFAPHGLCQTPLRDFDNYGTAGATRSGCVVFALANGAKLIEIRFSAHGQAAGGVVWGDVR